MGNGASVEKGVANMFEKKGIVIVQAKEGEGLGEAEESAIEVGAEEVNEIEGGEETLFEFVTDPNHFATVKVALEKMNYVCRDAGVQYLPKIVVELNSLDAARSKKLIEALEQLDVVVSVHTNIS